uniref:Uncharacterized protein n=1 Tax=viral metagenome TaxID=1070528 RepID=A0A6H1ZLY9_9ZZZZ
MVSREVAKPRPQLSRRKHGSGVVKPRAHWDLKVREIGASNVIPVTKFVPKTWKFVRVWLIKQMENKVILHVEKLYEESEVAPPTNSNKEGE